jgi:hypothetical protein
VEGSCERGKYLRVPVNAGKFLAAQLAASQEGLSSMSE